MKTAWAHPKKEYEANLSSFRLGKGDSIKDVCLAIGIHPGEYSGLNNGSIAPIRNDGKIKNSAQKLANYLGATLEDLWPRYFCGLSEYVNPQDVFCAVHENSMHGAGSDSAETVLERSHLQRMVSCMLRTLSVQQRKVLLGRFAMDMTLEELGTELGISRERVRQIEIQGLNKMRHSSRSRLLRWYYEDGPMAADVECGIMSEVNRKILSTERLYHDRVWGTQQEKITK